MNEDGPQPFLPQALSLGDEGSKHRKVTSEEKKLWEKHSKGDKAARNELVERYFSLIEVHSENLTDIILRMIQEKDLYQAVVLGYMKSIDAHETWENVPFEEFSYHHIREHVMKEIEDYICG